MESLNKIGFGGGCHWCTEAVFQAVPGVRKVKQGYIASAGDAAEFSEAVIVYYLPQKVSLAKLIQIHLHTHNSTSNHSFRERYRSAIYIINSKDESLAKQVLIDLQQEFKKKIITQILPFMKFRASRESIQNYYLKQPEAPFCKRYIAPKLQVLKENLDQSEP